MKATASKMQTKNILQELAQQGLEPMPLYGVERTVIAVIGDERTLNTGHLESLPGVDRVMRVLKPYKLVSRELQPEPTVINVNGVAIGSTQIAMMAGPCSVESEEQMEEVASALAKEGIKIIRGGAYKPRTGPYSFQGLGARGLEILQETAQRHNMATITEVLDVRDLDQVCAHADILQIGTRNMQNFELLKAVGAVKKPVMLKRGLSATVEEFLLAAEYILSHGNPQVMLCERGIRTFETDTRNTLALATIPLVKELSHLPIIVDPTHATGKRSLINSMTKAALAAGADGIIIEVHAHPEKALSDAQQQVTPEEFHEILQDALPIIKAVGRTL